MRLWYQLGGIAAILVLTATLATAGDGEKKARSGPKIGDAAPAFELKATDGKTYKLADLKDKTVVLEWINRECPVCKKQAPQMKATAESMQAKGVIWLAIDSTAAHALADNAEHVKADKLPYPILDDHEGTVGKAYGSAHTPTMFIVHKGKIAYTGALVPAKGDERNYVKEAAEALLAGKEPPLAETEAYGCSVKYKK
ncbi:Thiol-disulfide oxidoreductase ResA [Phycisphaerae bacterium RAS1]|nr:Thiol-disulfide oxidoreductase ResA [Phycisphaerae bacterium RAS1]